MGCMKKWIVAAILCLATLPAARAQRLLIGEKIPEIRISDWYGGRSPSDLKRATLLYFFHSSSEQCRTDIQELENLTARYADRMNVVVVTKEGPDKIGSILGEGDHGPYVAFDREGKIFTAFSVRFVPFCVLCDNRSRLVWTGNLTSLNGEAIEKSLR